MVRDHNSSQSTPCSGELKKKKKKVNKTRGPTWPWIAHLNFDITIANFPFLSLSEKNLQEFLYVCTVQVAPIH